MCEGVPCLLIPESDIPPALTVEGHSAKYLKVYSPAMSYANKLLHVVQLSQMIYPGYIHSIIFTKLPCTTETA